MLWVCSSGSVPCLSAANNTGADGTAPGLYCKRSSDLSASEMSSYPLDVGPQIVRALSRPWTNLIRAQTAALDLEPSFAAVPR
jgi:hypothetical protein